MDSVTSEYGLIACFRERSNNSNFFLKRFIAQTVYIMCKGKGLPQQAEVGQGFPGRLRPRIFLTFGTTRVVIRQPYAPAAFIPGEIPGTHFQRLSRPQGTWFRR